MSPRCRRGLGKAGMVACLVWCASLTLAGVAQAATVALGRWRGTGPGGQIQFVVSRVRGTLVLSDLVATCGTSAGVGGDDAGLINFDPDLVGRNEVAVRADGQIDPDDSPAGRGYVGDDGVSGTLSGGRGVVSAGDGAAFGSTGDDCPDHALRDVRVVRSGAPERADGVYDVTGALGTSGILWVFGEGALIEANASFATPVGGSGDSETACAEADATASLGLPLGLPDTHAILPSPSGAITSHITDDTLGIINEVGLTAGFTTPTTIQGTYSGVFADGVALVCLGTGPFTATLAHRAPTLLPIAVPGQPLPSRNRSHRPRPRPRRRARTIRYVALGDSYSSGEGVAPYEKGTDTRTDRCHRSTRAYPELLRLPGIHFKRVSYACSGATTANFPSDGESRFDEPPQLTHADLRRAGLVTLTVGGNDAGFSSVVTKCTRLVPIACFRGRTARNILNGITSLAPVLASTYEAVRAEVPPGTRIVVLDYPDLFPPAGGNQCGKLRALFSKPARAFLRRAGSKLDDVIEAAALKAGVKFVDVRRAFAGHEVCSRSEWVDFIVRGRHFLPSIGSFHPNASGQAAYAESLERAIARHP